jgi:LPS sulfotransferase NodH
MDNVYTSLFPLDFTEFDFYVETQQSIENYYYRGLEPGKFVYYMLANNFSEAVVRADPWNQLILDRYAQWLIERMPMVAWGSEEKVNEWMRSFKHDF